MMTTKSLTGHLSLAVFFSLFFQAASALAEAVDKDTQRPRARDIGLVVGILSTGENNAITDVDGVLVGHTTVIEEPDIHTGVTAIIPAPGNLYTHPVPAWIQ